MSTEALGTFERHNDDIDVRFERYYPRPVARVWSAITDPERLADWMGVSRVEPRVGGRIELMVDGPHPATGRITVWEPPAVLEFTWSNTHAPNSTIRYELQPQGSGTRLVFTHTGMPYTTSALMLPGWHNFLARLAGVVAGTPPQVKASYRDMQAAYVDHYKLHGVILNI